MANWHEFDVIVVGAGFYGLTLANIIAEKSSKKVLIIEKRDHIGGNAYSYMDSRTNVEIHKYGSHIFHTSNKKVIDYIYQFSKFNNYIHKVKTVHNNEIYSLPINLHTLSQFFKKEFSPLQAKDFFNTLALQNRKGDNFEEAAKFAIGEDLYTAFFEGYTLKQWGLHPSDIPAQVFARLPIRFDFNDNYFSDDMQGLPQEGYFNIFNKMISSNNIRLELETEFISNMWEVRAEQDLVFTGPIDQYFGFKHGKLNWRTLDLIVEHHNVDDFQGTSVLNYADKSVNYTRIHEFHHLHPERKKAMNKTVIMKEFSRKAEDKDDCYYPVNTQEDRVKLDAYRKLALKQSNIHFGGRLGRYQYLDMHMAIASAMTLAEAILERN